MHTMNFRVLAALPPVISNLGTNAVMIMDVVMPASVMVVVHSALLLSTNQTRQSAMKSLFVSWE